MDFIIKAELVSAGWSGAGSTTSPSDHSQNLQPKISISVVKVLLITTTGKTDPGYLRLFKDYLLNLKEFLRFVEENAFSCQVVKKSNSNQYLPLK